MQIRHPAVAGRFYPKTHAALLADVRSYLSPEQVGIDAIGCIVPHAGYIYSGHVAGAVFAKINIPQCCVVLGPNHTGLGRPLSINSYGTWETPLGSVPIASDLADALKTEFSPLSEDTEAHHAEHAIEVELPFLLARQPELSFVPVLLGTGYFDILEAFGIALAKVIADRDENVLIVASSDMNHYEDDQITRTKDFKAIEKILELDAPGMFETVKKENISMCGFAPTVAMLTAAKRLGAKSAELVKYGTSGDISGDRELVVGYAGIIVR